MARKSVADSRVELWSPYRETIKKDFLKAEKKQKKQPEVVKVPVVTEQPPKVTRAEALLYEYEKKKEKEEVRRGPRPIIIVITVVLFMLIIVGLVLLIKRYYK